MAPEIDKMNYPSVCVTADDNHAILILETSYFVEGLEGSNRWEHASHPECTTLLNIMDNLGRGHSVHLTLCYY